MLLVKVPENVVLLLPIIAKGAPIPGLAIWRFIWDQIFYAAVDRIFRFQFGFLGTQPNPSNGTGAHPKIGTITLYPSATLIFVLHLYFLPFNYKFFGALGLNRISDRGFLVANMLRPIFLVANMLRPIFLVRGYAKAYFSGRGGMLRPIFLVTGYAKAYFSGRGGMLRPIFLVTKVDGIELLGQLNQRTTPQNDAPHPL
jgi:hypothetical protein